MSRRALPTFTDGFMRGFEFVDNVKSRRRAEQQAAEDRDFQRIQAERGMELQEEAGERAQEGLDIRREQAESADEYRAGQLALAREREGRQKKLTQAQIGEIERKRQQEKALATYQATQEMEDLLEAARAGEITGRDTAILKDALSGKVSVAGPNIGLVRDAATRVLGPKLKKVVGKPAKGGGKIADVQFHNIIKDGDGFRVALKVTKDDGESYIAPLTDNRSADDDDTVSMLSMDDFMDAIKAREYAVQAVSEFGVDGESYEQMLQGLREQQMAARRQLVESGYVTPKDDDKGRFLNTGAGVFDTETETFRQPEERQTKPLSKKDALTEARRIAGKRIDYIPEENGGMPYEQYVRSLAKELESGEDFVPDPAAVSGGASDPEYMGLLYGTPRG